jgi:small conductance mechanosensitive channel
VPRRYAHRLFLLRTPQEESMRPRMPQLGGVGSWTSLDPSHSMCFSTTPNQDEDDKDDESEHMQKKKKKRWFRIRLSERFQRIILATNITDDRDLSRLIGTSLSGAVYGLAGISVLGTLGIDTKPLVAGIGITGFTVGFALKEIVGNFLAGALLVLSKPFEAGQYVRIQVSSSVPIEGIVQSIDARYVRILSETDGRVHVVPSSLAYSSALVVGKAPKIMKGK